LISVLQRYTLQQCLPENFCETHLDFFASEKVTLKTLPLCYFHDQPPKKIYFDMEKQGIDFQIRFKKTCNSLIKKI